MAKNTILLIEDDEILLKMYEMKFSRSGFEVITATDGAEGWQKITTMKEPPVIILLDLMLSKINGFELLNRLKLDNRLKNIPVLVLSNLGSSYQDKIRAELLGAAGYVIKSEKTPAEILTQVREIAGVKE